MVRHFLNILSSIFKKITLKQLAGLHNEIRPILFFYKIVYIGLILGYDDPPVEVSRYIFKRKIFLTKNYNFQSF